MKSKNRGLDLVLPVLLLTAVAPAHAGTPPAVSAGAALGATQPSLGFVRSSTVSSGNARSGTSLWGGDFDWFGNSSGTTGNADALTSLKSLLGGGGTWAQAVSGKGANLSFLNANWYSFGFLYSDSVFEELPQFPIGNPTGYAGDSPSLPAGHDQDSSAGGALSFLDALPDIGETAVNVPAGTAPGFSSDPAAAGHRFSPLNAALGVAEMSAMHVSGPTLAENQLNLSISKPDFMLHGPQSEVFVDPLTDNSPLTTAANPRLDPILPEPSTLVLGGLGATGLLLFRRRFRSLY